GANWEPVGTLPAIPVYDVDADTITNRLIAGTFARSLLSFPLDSLLPAPEVVEPNEVASFEAATNRVYPNPFTSTLNLNLGEDVQSVRVIDFSGRIVHKQTMTNTSTLVIQSGTWPAGKYVVVLETANGPRSLQVIKGQ
ncbi:MAG: T9SS type A sorting domain-containing protein, partial [Flavobacteriales bacterium]